MAQLIIAAAGAAIGGMIAPGVVALGMTGASIGWAAGSLIGSMFAPTQKSAGPRLGDLRVAGSSYGAPVPWVAGTPRIAGQVVWASAKREIATVTEQGKGGGGSEYTSYTYEVDLLILLTANVVPGISRVWSNGDLIYNMLSTASAETRAASEATPAWSRITYYDGNAAQDPDPTYEAAVGAANAPAYRGRGSVFIQSLQLGSSGQLPNLTFEMDNTYPGDHPAGDGLTRLQCTFDGASSADISEYALGSGTITESSPTYVDVREGELYIRLSGAVQNQLVWSAAGLGRVPLTGHTVEFFVRAVEIDPNPAFGATMFFDTAAWGMANSRMTFDPVSGGKNVARAYATAWYTYPDTEDLFIRFAADTHVAFVTSADEFADLRVYINGQLLYTSVGTATAVGSPYNGSVTLGGIGSSVAAEDFYFTGVRVRRAEMYTGSSFTPPASPDDWGPP
jgi:hypothetical protein